MLDIDQIKAEIEHKVKEQKSITDEILETRKKSQKVLAELSRSAFLIFDEISTLNEKLRILDEQKDWFI